MTTNNITNDLTLDDINDTLTKMEDLLGGNFELMQTIILILYHNGTLTETEFHKLNEALDIKKKENQQRSVIYDY
jgi:hypothetical protein